MIIEITGPSGVGKTTYIKNLCSYLDRGGRDTGAIHSVSLNKCKGIPKEFCEINSHNIKTDLRSLPWFFFLALKNPRFIFFCIVSIIKLKESLRNKINITRSIIRKIGIYQFLNRKKFKDILILVDEGIIHSCHNLLVSTKQETSLKAVVKFYQLAPFPDKLIFLQSPTGKIIHNLQNRGDISPRVGKEGHLDIFVLNACNLFNKLSNLYNKDNLSLIVYYDDFRDINYNDAISYINEEEFYD